MPEGGSTAVAKDENVEPRADTNAVSVNEVLPYSLRVHF
jgi:hypothetical protein